MFPVDVNVIRMSYKPKDHYVRRYDISYIMAIMSLRNVSVIVLFKHQPSASLTFFIIPNLVLRASLLSAPLVSFSH